MDEIESPKPPHLRQVVEIIALAVPVAVCVALLHEVGFFGAIGFRPDYAFMAVLPIPTQEIVRAGILALLFLSLIFIGIAAFGAVLYHIWKTWYSFQPEAADTVNSNGPDDRPLLPTKLTTLFGYVDTISGTLGSLRSILNGGWTKLLGEWKVILKPISGFLFAVILLFAVVFPLVELVTDRNTALGPLYTFFIFLVGLGTGATLSASLALWLIGENSLHRLKLPKYTALAISIFWLLVITYSIGFNAGVMTVLDENGKRRYPGLVAAQFTAKCPTKAGTFLVRSYSNGVLLFTPGELTWMSTEKEFCMVIELDRIKYKKSRVTPTIFGFEVIAMSYDKIVPVEN